MYPNLSQMKQDRSLFLPGLLLEIDTDSGGRLRKKGRGKREGGCVSTVACRAPALPLSLSGSGVGI